VWPQGKTQSLRVKNKKLKKEENIRNFFEKGIDFMENLRYNWTVHEHKTEQEV